MITQTSFIDLVIERLLLFKYIIVCVASQLESSFTYIYIYIYIDIHIVMVCGSWSERVPEVGVHVSKGNGQLHRLRAHSTWK